MEKRKFGIHLVWNLLGTAINKTYEKNFLEPTTPEVFFSGALHGDERVGTTTVTELALFLCENYTYVHN